MADRNRRQKHVERARIVLLRRRRGLDGDYAPGGLRQATVWRWQERFREAGVEGLLRDESRPPGKAPLAQLWSSKWLT